MAAKSGSLRSRPSNGKLLGKHAVKQTIVGQNVSLSWVPWFRHIPYRRVGRPTARWADEFMGVAGGDWQTHAQDEELWAILAMSRTNE